MINCQLVTLSLRRRLNEQEDVVHPRQKYTFPAPEAEFRSPPLIR